ncbi:MAG TPA: pyrroloquinoline quinone-dependent dehydrogenase [Steroidobacteraceae bacterium]|nr:pyrroloquinoline quinone-dependent dehydrogenase [Steroidobacteraceae bacterium]
MRSLPILLAWIVCGAHASTDRIAPANVERLEVAWVYDTGDSTEPLAPGADRPSFEATPVYADGALYVSTPLGTVAALDADSGRQLWKVDLQIRRNTDYSDFANRGPAIRGERLYIGTVDGRLVCLERTNGRFCADFADEGQIDLSRGLRHPPEWHGEYGVTSPPAIYRDLVIVGSSVADNGRARMASGEVRAFDAASGALRWTFHPLPPDGQAGGANTWSRIVVDHASGLAYLPTGSASPDYFGGLRPGDDRYANSLVAVHAQTGEPVWHFQLVHHDLWDYDTTTPPLLYPGRDGPAVAVGNKSGHVFLLNRLTGEPLFPVIEKPVPRSDVPGEQAAPTQPFPTKPVSLVPQRVTEDDLWGATPEDLESCRRTFRTLRNEGVFTPPSLAGSLHVPGNIGGLHWGGFAWDPTQRLLIAPVNRLPAIIRLIPRAGFDEAQKKFPARETTEQDGTPFAMSREFFRSPSGKPCIAPPWGELVAINVDSGDSAWRAPLGLNLGGPATTDTGLVFIGASLEPYLRAFETRTGKELWKGQLPTSARATPLIYTSARGRQMVAIAAGGHDAAQSKPDTKLVVFALHD